jgi:competence protein ComEC
MSEAPPSAAQPRSDTPRYHPLVIVLVAVCAGIVTDRCWSLPVWLWWAAAGIAWVVWLSLWRCRWDRASAVPLLLAAAATAASWHHCRWYLFPADDLGTYTQVDEFPVCLEAVALGSPRTLPPPPADPMRMAPAGEQVRLDVAPILLRQGGCWRDVSGRARLVVAGNLPAIYPGDRLRIFAQLSAPPAARNPGEHDRAAHLRGDRIRSQLRSEAPQCVALLASGRPWSLGRLLEQVRAHGNRLFARYLDPRRAALAAAVLLGQREQLEPKVTEAFVKTNTVHLLCISGLHVGILAGTLMFLLRRAMLPRGWGVLIVAGFTVLYALMVDAEPPVVRATILVLVTCVALWLGRRPLGFNTLAAAAMVVLALNPADLFHTGAQLSFLCVAGLVWFALAWWDKANQENQLERLIAENLGWLAGTARHLRRSLWSLLLMGAMIWLVSLPLVMARFHLFSPVALLLNPLLWVPIELALLSGLATLILGMLVPPLAPLCGGLCNGTFWLLEAVVTAARDLPGSHFWVPGPQDWWLAGFYGGLGVLASFPRLRPPRRWCLALLALWAAVGFGAAGLRRHPSRLDCTFLAMGHGCAVVLELPTGQTMLYDGGRMGLPETATRSIAGMLWSRGITHLDAVVLSHGDVDHYNALPGLLEKFSVGVVYASPVMLEKNNLAMAALKDAIRRRGVPLREIWAGDRLAGGEQCCIEVLHPLQGGVPGSENANSVVLAVEYLGQRILLPGDLDSPGLGDLLAEEPTHCDVLLAPHHGSQRSNSPGLAAWSTPNWVVISGSHRWDIRPIVAAYRGVGSRVLPTADVGAVHVRIDRSGVGVDSFSAH